jgi:hypothetical protein
MVLGDTFIETFSTGRLRDFLTEKEENYRQKPLPDHLKSIQLPSECYLFNTGEFKRHNVTATYAKQTLVRKGKKKETESKKEGTTEEDVIEVPMSPRLFPDKATSTPVHANIYVVPHLKTNTFHDLRLSYSSSTPAQFSMEVFNLPKYEAYFPEHLESCCKECQNLDEKDTLIIMIKANYDGVTTTEVPSTGLVIPYNIVFEPYLFYILPRNVIPLIAFLGVLSLIIVFGIIPNTFQHIHHIKQE